MTTHLRVRLVVDCSMITLQSAVLTFNAPPASLCAQNVYLEMGRGGRTDDEVGFCGRTLRKSYMQAMLSE